MKKTESLFGSKTNNLTNAAVDLLNARGCKAWRQNNHPVPVNPTPADVIAAAAAGGKMKLKFRKNKKQLSGISDVIGTLPWGQSIYIEIKTGRDKQSREQKLFHEDIIRRRGIYIIIRDVDELIKYIEIIFAIKNEILSNTPVLQYFNWNINEYILYNFNKEKENEI